MVATDRDGTSPTSAGVKSQDAFCDLVEGFFKTVVKGACHGNDNDREVTCVYVKFPQCSTEDICNNRNGCGYVQDNDLVKFTGYSCKGHVGFDGGKPSGNFQLDCSPALTPLATILIVALAIIGVAACACFLWCCCRR